MIKKIVAFLFAFLLVAVVRPAYADTVVSMDSLFGGRNIYAPTLLDDGGTGRMWYGGWQVDSDFPNDRIYYRALNPDFLWSEYLTILVPSDIAPDVAHVNDPSVTKHFNQVTQAWQYTMFFTVCVSQCEQSDNQIWSAVSNDGIIWLFPQVLLSGPQGSAEPSARFDPQDDGGVWSVYYVDRYDCRYVKMARVDGNRRLISTQIVYAWTGTPGCISSAEVKFFNGKWHLFFNVFFLNSQNLLDRIDIYKSESYSDTFWPSTFELLIANTGQTFCATLTPGVAPVSDIPGQYDLFFGLVPRHTDGSCEISESQGVYRWRWKND